MTVRRELENRMTELTVLLVSARDPSREIADALGKARAVLDAIDRRIPISGQALESLAREAERIGYGALTRIGGRARS